MAYDEVKALVFSNNSSTTLDGGVLDTDVSITVVNGGVFVFVAANEYMKATIVSSAGIEIVNLRLVTGNVIDLDRGQEGTIALSHPTGAKIEGRATAHALRDLVYTDRSYASPAQAYSIVDIAPYRYAETDFPSGWGSIGIGIGNKVDGYGSIAIGIENPIPGADSIVVGNNNVSNGSTRNFVIGKNNTINQDIGESTEDVIAIGSNSIISSNTKTLVSLGTVTVNESTTSICIGHTAKVSEVGSATIGAISIGVGSHAVDSYSCVLGRYAYANSYGGVGKGIAIGSYAYSLGGQNLTIGNSAFVGSTLDPGDSPTQPTESVAIGNSSNASGSKCIALGSRSNTGYDFGGDESIAIGFQSGSVSALRSIALGSNATASDYADSTAIGAFSEVSATNSLSLGFYNRCHVQKSISIGDRAIAGVRSSALWRSNTSFSVGDIVYIAQGASPGRMSLVCVSDGTTSDVEPSPANNVRVTDGTCVWYSFDHPTYYSSTSANQISLGDAAATYGGDSVCLGGIASISRSVSLGTGSAAYGADVVAINAQVVGTNSVGINSENRGRANTKNVVCIGGGYQAISHTGRVEGTDYIPFENGNYWPGIGSKGDGTFLRTSSAREQTFTSPPLCVGSNPWQASTVYSVGDVVTPTTPDGFSYYAWIWQGDEYFGQEPSAATEPVWANAVNEGDSVMDGNILWYKVDPVDMVLSLPDHLRFIPTAVGFIGTDKMVSTTIQPTLSFGVSGYTDKWSPATITTKLTGALARHSFDPVNTEGSKTLAASVTSLSDGATIGRYFWTGLCIEIYAD